MPARQSVGSYELSIASGESETLYVAGSFLRCVEADQGEFEVSLDDESSWYFDQGTLYRVDPGDPAFEKVTVKNTTGSTMNVTFIIGFGDYQDDRLRSSGNVSSQVVIPATVLSATPVTVPDDIQTTIVGSNSARAQLHITNHAAYGSGHDIQIGDVPGGAGKGSRGIVIPPGGTFTLTTRSVVRCWHNNGVDIDVSAVWTEYE